MARLARELRQPSHDWLVTVYRALFALLEGALADAEAWIAEARSLGERAQSWNATVTYRLQLYVLRREQGRLAEVEDLVRRSVAEYTDVPDLALRAGALRRGGGTAEAARDAFDRLAADGFAELPFDEEWLVSLGFLAETTWTLGDPGSAAVLYEQLLPYGDRVAVSYPEISTGAVARPLGMLAATMERWEDAGRHFEPALELNGRIGARPWLAHTQREYARMLHVRDAPGDAERAQRLASRPSARTGSSGWRPTRSSAGGCSAGAEHPPVEDPLHPHRDTIAVLCAFASRPLPTPSVMRTTTRRVPVAKNACRPRTSKPPPAARRTVPAERLPSPQRMVTA